MSSKKKTTTKSRRPTLTKKKSKQILSSMRRSISQIEHSMTSKQKKELKNISLDLANTHQQLIRFKEEGKLPEFLRDVCKLDKRRLLELGGILKVKIFSYDTYDSICEKIIKERPDLFKQFGENSWKSWISGLASIPAAYLTYKIPDWIANQYQQNNISELINVNVNWGDMSTYKNKFNKFISSLYNFNFTNSTYYNNMKLVLGVIALISGATGVRYYRLKHLQIAAAIQYLRNNPDLERVSKQITRSYSRSQSRKKIRRRSSMVS